MKLKELEEQIQYLIDHHIELNLKERSLRELLRVDPDLSLEATRSIVNNYPDFNSIYFRFESEGHYVIGLAINPQDLKTKKDIHRLAKGILKFAGGK